MIRMQCDWSNYKQRKFAEDIYRYVKYSQVQQL